MIKVEQIEQIRRAFYIDKKSIRQIAKEQGHARATVRQAIDTATPRQYSLRQERRSPKLGAYKARVQALLAENERLPRKQRYTWHKIYEIIKQEGYQGKDSNLRHYIAKQRQAKRRPVVYLPLEYDPGLDAQVDWGEAEVILKGQQVTVQLFVMRLCYSRRIFVMAFAHQQQEAFFWGHVEAFEHFGGVPQRLTYDNLKTAVLRVLEGKNRQEQASFIQFRSHYLFDSHFCTPGQGHEKGGVEHGVGYVRRNYLVPLPQVASYEELNAYLLAKCLEDDQRQVAGQAVTIQTAWEQERLYLRPLPAQAYACCSLVSVTLTPYSQVVIETNRYSVPVDQAAKQLLAKVYPFRVEIYRPGDKSPIASHARCYGHKQDIFDPLHYLPLLEQRPGAFNHAKPIRQWRQQWPQLYNQLLNQLQAQWPQGRGIREFIRVLGLHQHYPSQLVEQAINQALNYNCAHADGVLLCLHQLSQPLTELSELDLNHQPHLQTIGTQPVNLNLYNQLLEGEPCQ